MTQMVNLTHTEHGHNGLVLVIFGPEKRRVTLRSVLELSGEERAFTGALGLLGRLARL
jgi:hypothetical protein